MDENIRVTEIPFEQVKILPPKPGTCPICAVKHRPEQPHNPQSLYYQMKFRQQHGRFPTWADAMAHCEEYIKKMWVDALAERGVIVELPDSKVDGDTE